MLTYLYQEPRDDEAPVLRANILGSATESFFDGGQSPMPLYVERTAFERLGGFSTDYPRAQP